MGPSPGLAWLYLVTFAAALLATQVRGLRIRPRPCKNALGQEGTCMFVLECINTDGKHLGTCMDDFFFGSCCAHNEGSNTVPDTGSDKSPTNAHKPSSSTTTTDIPNEIQGSRTSTVGSVVSVTSSALAVANLGWTVHTAAPKPPIIINRWTTSPPYRPTFSPFINRPFTFKPHSTTTSTTSTTTTTTTPVPISETSLSVRPDATLPATNFGNSPSPDIEKECGQTHQHPQTKVVGGKNAAYGAWPWQVSVRRTSFFGFSSTHRCGGAIVNSQWIATAGHCVDDLLLSQIRIRVGEYDFASMLEPNPYVERSALKKVVHPNYNFFTYENDLALVKLDEPLVFNGHIAPICLPPNEDSLIGKNATVTGWGRLSEGGVLPSILQQVQVPIVSNEKCKNMFLAAGRHEYIPDIFMCAGYQEGGRDSCQGDSGGPLQVQKEDGRWFLAGIISWGIGCAEPNLPGVCTRISKFKDWIIRNIT